MKIGKMLYVKKRDKRREWLEKFHDKEKEIKPKSQWSESNKERVRRLIKDGKMTQAGFAVLENKKFGTV